MEINSSKRMGNVSLLIVSHENKIYLDHKENLQSDTYIYIYENIHEISTHRLKLNANITVVKSSSFFLKTCHIEISVPVNSLNMTIQFIPLYCQYTTLVKIIVQIVHY